MKAGDKKKSSTGGTIEKTKTGLKHTAGKNYSGKSAEVSEDMEPEDLGTVAEINRLIAKGMHETDAIHAVAKKYGDNPSELASFYYQHNMHEGKHANDCDCKECMMQEGDEGKHNNGKTTGFKAVANKAAKEYGSKKAGERVAGAVRAKMAKAGKLEESQYKHNVRFVNESINFLLQEDEEAKAKTITAAGDIVNDYTSWMQRVGQYQTKAIIELADSIRADFGQAEAETFKQTVAPALSATLETLTQQREAISSAVAALAGGAAPADPMGADPMGTGMEPGLDAAGPDEMNPPVGGDEFGASDAAAGGGVTAGRAMRESKEQRIKRKLDEAHNLMAVLSK